MMALPPPPRDTALAPDERAGPAGGPLTSLVTRLILLACLIVTAVVPVGLALAADRLTAATLMATGVGCLTWTAVLLALTRFDGD